MNVLKLAQDILRCQEVVSEITIKHYGQNDYKEMINSIFKDIFKEYLECPDKLEPQERRIPKEGLERIRKSQGYESNR